MIFTFSVTLKLTQPMQYARTQFLETEFKKYVANYRRFRHVSSCGYINVNSEATKDVSNLFIKHNMCPSLIVGDNFNFNASGIAQNLQKVFHILIVGLLLGSLFLFVKLF